MHYSALAMSLNSVRALYRSVRYYLHMTVHAPTCLISNMEDIPECVPAQRHSISSAISLRELDREETRVPVAVVVVCAEEPSPIALNLESTYCGRLS